MTPSDARKDRFEHDPETCYDCCSPLDECICEAEAVESNTNKGQVSHALQTKEPIEINEAWAFPDDPCEQFEPNALDIAAHKFTSFQFDQNDPEFIAAFYGWLDATFGSLDNDDIDAFEAEMERYWNEEPSLWNAETWEAERERSREANE
jgi:hypothetical protein